MKYLLGLLVLLSGNLLASDHIDFPEQAKHIEKALDLTDLFAWTPSKGRLAFAVNTHMFASSESRFSDAAEYIFRIRPISATKQKFTASDKEVTVVCRFTSAVATQTVTCTANNKTSASIQLGDTTAPASAPLRIFAGVRADPFFLDTTWAKGAVMAMFIPGYASDALAPQKTPKNFSNGLNILNLTIELDVATILGTDSQQVAIAAEVRNSRGKQIDRVGRPEITNLTLRHDAYKVRYNEIDTFHMTKQDKVDYRKSLKNGVQAWDKLDYKADWKAEQLDAFVEVLVNDYLIVNTHNVCDVDAKSFLALEINQDAATCGGRTPNDDVIDAMFSLYAGATEAYENRRYGDGVENVLSPAGNDWPYFAKAYPSK